MDRPGEITNTGTDPFPMPFSFVYDGRPSGDLLGGWQATTTARSLDECRTERVSVFTDPYTDLEVRCEVIAYQDSPSIEWLLHFTNTGSQGTPIIEDILPLDMAIASQAQPLILHHAGWTSRW